MEGKEKDTAAANEAADKVVALKVLQRIYSDQLNEYERQMDEVSALGRVNRNTLYNKAVLHEIEGVAQRRGFEELLSAVWVAQSMLDDIVALQRTVCVLKRSMDEGALATVEREERGIDHESLPYETI
ncbi:MAG TPA: hypothetical protein PLJ11_02575 [Methanomassiliicoccales archaeon]|nr:hypothetical protein [Methanomassiliicoccales archaeon]